MKIFGSDGFRCKFGTKFMTESFLIFFSESISELYKNNVFKKPVLVGRDTRKTGEIIENIFSSVFLSNGVDVTSIGVVSTPGLSHIIRNNEFDLGIMITASHNPAEDNGIKLFAGDGFKLEQKLEKMIEQQITNKIAKTNN